MSSLSGINTAGLHKKMKEGDMGSVCVERDHKEYFYSSLNAPPPISPKNTGRVEGRYRRRGVVLAFRKNLLRARQPHRTWLAHFPQHGTGLEGHIICRVPRVESGRIEIGTKNLLTPLIVRHVSLPDTGSSALLLFLTGGEIISTNT